jgi:5-methylcytosine-specific restriction endonuclease McrA
MRVLYEKRAHNARKRTRTRHSWLYRAYIERGGTLHWLWKIRRRRWLRQAGLTCERCGAWENLTIHHRTYERLGHERRADIEVLCWHCHSSADSWRHLGGPGTPQELR